MSSNQARKRQEMALEKALAMQRLLESQDYEVLLTLNEQCKTEPDPAVRAQIKSQMYDIIKNYGFSKKPISNSAGYESEIDKIFDHLFLECKYGGGGDRYW